jgi:competence ComEA-like helix-hairpin-helix protein
MIIPGVRKGLTLLLQPVSSMFNRQEQTALLLLSAALLLGTGLAVVDRYDPEAMEEFHVIEGAVEVPAGAPAADRDPPPPEPAAAVAVNSATAAQLQRLPSIGPKTAARIISFREENGPFARLEDLLEVKGIGPATLEKIRPQVTLN